MIIKNYIYIVISIILFSNLSYGEHISLSQDANGWTQFSPSSDSDIAYVSEDDGNNTTCDSYRTSDGVWEVSGTPFEPDSGEVIPCEDFATAYALTGSGEPDWILFKRGETFTESSGLGRLERSGKNADEPFLVSSYGSSGNCPIIQTGSSGGIELRNDNQKYVALMGLDFYANGRNPNDGGSLQDGGVGLYLFWYNRTATGFLIEGCKFRFVGSIIQAAGTTYDVTDIKVRRCIFSDSYKIDSHSQGLYISRVDGIILEENIFIHNGWYQQSYNGGQENGQATAFNHNVYAAGATNMEFDENIFIQPSSANIKITNPDGNTKGALENIIIDNDLFLDGEVAISAGYNYQPGGDGGSPEEECFPFRLGNIRISNNVVTQIGRSNPTNRSLAWGFMFAGVDAGNVSNNLSINQETAGITNVRGMYILGDTRNTPLDDNIFYNLQSGIGILIDENSATNTGNSFSGTQVQLPTSGEELIYMTYAGSGEFSFTDSEYYTTVSDGNRFYYNTGNVSDSSWTSTIGDSFSWTQKSYTDDTRDVDTYVDYVESTSGSTISDFINYLRAQDRYNWNHDYDADNVNDWIRTGFDLSEYGAGGGTGAASGGGSGSATGGGTGSMSAQ